MAGKLLTLNEVLEELQLVDDFSQRPVDLYITPPDEDGRVMDEDSGEHDAVHFILTVKLHINFHIHKYL